jgi:hypothetical protein
MDIDTEIYRGGFHSLLHRFEKKRRPYANADKALPAEDVDLEALAQQIIAPHVIDPSEPARYCAYSKQDRLRQELSGQSELHLLHALLIAILRRRDPPMRAQLLFHRIWRENGKSFVGEISVRWMISAATTFADCGQTGDQRACGMGLSILFDMIKLHDSERSNSGRPGQRPFRQKPGSERQSLAFNMQPYAIRKGDLDHNMLARLWMLCENDDTIAPLGFHMLRLVMHDRRSIFGRMQRLKSIKKREGRLLQANKTDPEPN